MLSQHFRGPSVWGGCQTRAGGEILSKNVLVQSLFVVDNDVAVNRRLQTKSELKVVQWSAQKRISHGMQFSMFPFPIQIFLFQCNATSAWSYFSFRLYAIMKKCICKIFTRISGMGFHVFCWLRKFRLGSSVQFENENSY